MFRFRTFALNWLLTQWSVQRTLRGTEHNTWMCLGYAPPVQWRDDQKHVVRTWRWNAERIAQTFRQQTGQLYTYTVTHNPQPTTHETADTPRN